MEYNTGMTVGDMKKFISELDKSADSAMIVMSFNGVDNNLRIISDADLTNAYDLMEPDCSDESFQVLKGTKVLHLHSDRLHYEISYEAMDELE